MKRKINIFTAIITTMFVLSISSIFAMAIPEYNQEELQITNTTTYSDDALYSETATQNTVTDAFSYSRKEVVSYKINNSFPNYHNTNALLTNTCANVAGANVIGYYDRYYEELIPNCAAGILRGTNYSYYPMNTFKEKKQAVIDWLYAAMKTNTIDDGTTEDDCLEGLAEYVQEKGRSITYSSVMTGAELNFDEFETELKEGKPIMFFLSGYNYVSVNDSGNSVTITINEYTGNHIVVAYGYQKIDYYNANNSLIESNIYIFISTGIESTSGFYLLNYGGNINSAKAVDMI